MNIGWPLVVNSCWVTSSLETTKCSSILVFCDTSLTVYSLKASVKMSTCKQSSSFRSSGRVGVSGVKLPGLLSSATKGILKYASHWILELLALTPSSSFGLLSPLDLPNLLFDLRVGPLTLGDGSSYSPNLSFASSF